MMAERSVNSPAYERRVALEKRRRVSEMSREEMQRELLTSEVTGLPNRRAFGEAGTAPAVAMSDVDGLKALNKYGYEAGNAILKSKADALREAGLEAYHDKGDEFLCRSDDIEELMARLELARAILRNCTIVVQRGDGSSLSVTGADFSYGVGKDIDEAELGLRNHKAEREDMGEIVRGELCGITIKNRKSRTSASSTKPSPRLCLATRRKTTAATN
jgi:GGDEF domain-containing protein